ncbi:LD-carboxypeptidase [Frateuria aurantia]
MSTSQAPVIRLLAPSSVPADLGAARRGVLRLQTLGCEVQEVAVLDRQMQRFAGTDAERAADINRLATLDVLPDLALAVRGGYGAGRLLAELDYPALAERLRGGALPLIGYSDFTALQMALYTRSGVVSLAGPMLTDFGAAPPSAFTWHRFWSTLSQPRVELQWQPGPESAEAVACEGRLWGGNLAMLCSLSGTPYFPSIDDGLLFLEDIGEAPYRVERLLYQLLWSGVLARQQAVILGDFTDCAGGPRDLGYDLAEALQQFRRQCPVPVIDGLPFGHGRDKATLPFGVTARLEAAGDRAVLRFAGHPRLRQPFEPSLPAASPAEVA